MLPTANHHCSSRRRDYAIPEDMVYRTLSHVLDIVVQGDVGEHQLKLIGYKPATGTVNQLALFASSREGPSALRHGLPRMLSVAKGQKDIARSRQALVLAVD